MIFYRERSTAGSCLRTLTLGVIVIQEGAHLAYVIVGVSSKTGTVHRLKPMKERGEYQLTAPNLTADQRKREANYTWVADIEEVVRLIEEEGYYARMYNVENDQAPDIIANEFIKVFRIP